MVAYFTSETGEQTGASRSSTPQTKGNSDIAKTEPPENQARFLLFPLIIFHLLKMYIFDVIFASKFLEYRKHI